MSMFDDLIPRGQPNVTVRPSRGERNMNPGNIEDGPFARSQPGYAGSDGRFARFDSAENGLAAIDALLSSYGRRGFNTPEAIINRWAPPSDNNPTSNYSAYVAEGLGVQPNVPLDMNDPGVRRQVAERIAQFETGKRQNATPIPAQTRALSFDDLIPAAQPEQPQGGPNITIRPTNVAQPSVGAGDALAGGVAQGVTLNFYDELRGLMEAGGLDPKDPASLVSLLQGAYKYWSGDPEAAQRYDAATSREREAQKAAEEQQPVASFAGNAIGAIALPVGGALQAATLPGRVVRGAAVGGAAGAAYGAGEGSGLEDRASRAAVGGALGAGVGAVAPPIVEGVIQGARALGRPVASALRGATDPETEAARRVMGALQRDAAADVGAVSRLTPQEFVASAQQGGPARVMDLGGDTTRALARSAANTSPEGLGVLNRVINDRFESQGSRIVDWLNNTFHFPNAQAQQRAIDQVERRVNSVGYRRAYQAGDREIFSPELERLLGSPAVGDAMAAAVAKGKDRAVAQGFGAFNPAVTIENGLVRFNRKPNGTPAYPNIQFWDYTYRELRDASQAAYRAGRNGEGEALSNLARTMRAELDRLVPEYGQARGAALQFFQAENALEAGQNFVRQNLGNREARVALARMSPQERQLFQDGFVSRFIETIEATGDRRNVLNSIANSAAAREKLNIALGPQRAAELEAILRVEGIMDLARGAVQGNSTTPRQLAELGFAGGAGSVGAYGAYNLDPQQMTYAAVAGALLAGKKGIDTRVARRVAEMLTSNDPRVLRRGINLVARNERMMNSLRAADQRIARIGAAEAPTGSAPAIQSMGTSRAEEEQPGVPRPHGQ